MSICSSTEDPHPLDRGQQGDFAFAEVARVRQEDDALRAIVKLALEFRDRALAYRRKFVDTMGKGCSQELEDQQEALDNLFNALRTHHAEDLVRDLPLTK